MAESFHATFWLIRIAIADIVLMAGNEQNGASADGLRPEDVAVDTDDFILANYSRKRAEKGCFLY